MNDDVLLILFPDHKLGNDLIFQSVRQTYETTLFVLTKEDAAFFSNLETVQDNKIAVFQLKMPLSSNWDDLFFRARAVINSMGTDWLKMKVEEQGTAWRINHDEPGHTKFAFVEKILQTFDKEKKVVWINLAYGNHKRSPDGQTFCNTRYGLTGFLKTVEITPHLRNLKIINICLSYFLRLFDEESGIHCRHCITKDFLDQNSLSVGQRDLAAYLFYLLEKYSFDKKSR